MVDGYNESYHSSIKQAPVNINKENEAEVWAQQYLPKKSKKMQKVKFKFARGDLVHISKARNPFS